MKRKYIYEASVAGIVLISLFVFLSPPIECPQFDSQPEALQGYVENVVKYLARSNNTNMITHLRGRHSAGYSGPIHRAGVGKIHLYFREDNSYILKNDFIPAFKSVCEPGWDASNLAFVVTVNYAHKSVINFDSLLDNDNFETKPAMISVLAVVGFEGDEPNWLMHSSPYSLVDDADGYLTPLTRYTL